MSTILFSKIEDVSGNHAICHVYFNFTLYNIITQLSINSHYGCFSLSDGDLYVPIEPLKRLPDTMNERRDVLFLTYNTFGLCFLCMYAHVYRRGLSFSSGRHFFLWL